MSEFIKIRYEIPHRATLDTRKPTHKCVGLGNGACTQAPETEMLFDTANVKYDLSTTVNET